MSIKIQIQMKHVRRIKKKIIKAFSALCYELIFEIFLFQAAPGRIFERANAMNLLTRTTN